MNIIFNGIFILIPPVLIRRLLENDKDIATQYVFSRNFTYQNFKAGLEDIDYKNTQEVLLTGFVFHFDVV